MAAVVRAALLAAEIEICKRKVRNRRRWQRRRRLKRNRRKKKPKSSKKKAEEVAAKEALEERDATNRAESKLQLGKAFLAVWDQEPEAAENEVAKRMAKAMLVGSRFKPF